MLEYDILKISKQDAQEVYRLMHLEVRDGKLLHNIQHHIRHGVAYKMVIDKKIKAVLLAKKYDTHWSLSYYFIDESLRKKMPSLFFFMHAMKKLEHLPIYIKANKNLKDYERYFEHSGGGVYKFKGLREDASWAELLKQ